MLVSSDPLQYKCRSFENDLDVKQQGTNLRVYSKSSRTISSNGSSLRPRICHRPVIPGCTRARPSAPLGKCAAHAIGFKVGGGQWPGPHQAHFAAQDIEDLRQLIQTVAAQPAANLGDSRVVFNFEDMPGLLVARRHMNAVGDRVHRAKLEADEMAGPPFPTRGAR